MKKLLLTVSALAALSLLAPSTGFAANNQVGFYSDAGFTSCQIDDFGGNDQFYIYVAIHNPVNNVGTVMETIGGFEFQFIMPGGTFITETTYASSGATGADVPGEFMYAFTEPVPVVPGTPTLVLTIKVFAGAGDNQLFYVGPADPPSVAGLALLDEVTHSMSMMYPATGVDLVTGVVFGINPDADIVDVEPATLDRVKALYR